MQVSGPTKTQIVQLHLNLRIRQRSPLQVASRKSTALHDHPHPLYVYPIYSYCINPSDEDSDSGETHTQIYIVKNKICSIPRWLLLILQHDCGLSHSHSAGVGVEKPTEDGWRSCVRILITRVWPWMGLENSIFGELLPWSRPRGVRMLYAFSNSIRRA